MCSNKEKSVFLTSVADLHPGYAGSVIFFRIQIRIRQKITEPDPARGVKGKDTFSKVFLLHFLDYSKQFLIKKIQYSLNVFIGNHPKREKKLGKRIHLFPCPLDPNPDPDPLLRFGSDPHPLKKNN